jgi:hypothetical protein
LLLWQLVVLLLLLLWRGAALPLVRIRLIRELRGVLGVGDGCCWFLQSFFCCLGRKGCCFGIWGLRGYCAGQAKQQHNCGHCESAAPLRGHLVVLSNKQLG